MVDLEDIKGVKKPVTFACVGKCALLKLLDSRIHVYVCSR